MKQTNKTKTNALPREAWSGWKGREWPRRAACSGAKSALVENWMRKRASLRRVKTIGRLCLSVAEFIELFDCLSTRCVQSSLEVGSQQRAHNIGQQLLCWGDS